MAGFDIKLSKIQVNLPGGRPLFAIREFHLPFGSHVLIQGESGRGKTTFLHLLAGLFAPEQGEVWVGDLRLDQLGDDRRCELRRDHIGVIFQKLNLIDHLTVAENTGLALAPGAEERDGRVSAALKAVNMAGREAERCAHLSLGEQQRVAVGRVLAQGPQILLADEPTSSLDERNGQFVIEALKKAATGKTLIVVSHDQRLKSAFERVLPFGELVR